MGAGAGITPRINLMIVRGVNDIAAVVPTIKMKEPRGMIPSALTVRC
jgi:hypothetical protein